MPKEKARAKTRATHLGMTAKEWGSAYQKLSRSNTQYQNAYQDLKKSSDKRIARLEWRIRTVNRHWGNKPSEVNAPNAKFIVRACNSHDELLEALRAVAGSYSVGGCSAQSLERALGELRMLAQRAIAKTEGR